MVSTNIWTVSDLRQREFARELSVVLGLLVVAQLYTNLMNVVLDPLHEVAKPVIGNHAAYTFAPVVPVLGGVCVVIAAYAFVRDVELPLSIPGNEDRNLVTLAVGGPLALLAPIFAIEAVRVGVTLGALREATAAGDLLGLVTGWWMLRWVAFVPVMALVYQGLVQGTFQRVIDRDLAVVLTTLIGAFLLGEITPSLGGVPPLWFEIDFLGAVGVLLFLSTFGIAVFASESTDNGRVQALAVLPVLVVVTVAAAGIVASIGSISGALFGVAQVAVLGFAAYAYDRSDSLLVPMATYGSFVVTNAIVSSVLLGATVAM